MRRRWLRCRRAMVVEGIREGVVRWVGRYGHGRPCNVVNQGLKSAQPAPLVPTPGEAFLFAPLHPLPAQMAGSPLQE